MFFDFPIFGQISFQDPATPIAEAIIDLHHNIFFYLILIFSLVLVILIVFYIRFSFSWEYPTLKDIIFRKDYLFLNNLVHASWLEIIWTITPSLILLLIAIPSFALLYAADELIDPQITVKIIGHQWYWSYERNDFLNSNNFVNFDSFMVPVDELKKGELRLLEVDNHLILPIHTNIRLIITASDVLHSFAVPSLGIKVDAVPGRLNQVSVYIKRPGFFYGQCSELCGVNHAFMPIKIQAVNVIEQKKTNDQQMVYEFYLTLKKICESRNFDWNFDYKKDCE
jgi:cytochrome c oxidase subunit 2